MAVRYHFHLSVVLTSFRFHAAARAYFYRVTLLSPLYLLPLPPCALGGVAALKSVHSAFVDSGVMGQPNHLIAKSISDFCAAAALKGLDGWRSPWDQDEV